MSQFITKKDDSGEEYVETNPEYKRYMAKTKYNFYLKNSGIPTDYHDIEFEHYEGKKSAREVETILTFANNPLLKEYHNFNLYLYGRQGNQKTMLACNVGKAFMKQGLSVKFVLAGTLINKLLKIQSYDRDPEIEKEIKSYLSCDLLILDDAFDRTKSLMWRNSKDLIISEWDMFLRERTSHDKKIVITSNMSLEGMRTDYEESLYNLLYRNFISLCLRDSIVERRKERFDELSI